uniref:Uncharacterized protein n=1 Tax=Peronospora matthiolae TaxID=2874970 RepID=A0AAV1TCN7_9STRA
MLVVAFAMALVYVFEEWKSSLARLDAKKFKAETPGWTWIAFSSYRKLQS